MYKKNWNIINESAQIELVLNILYYGISLFGTKRIGLIMQRGLKGTAFGQVIYDIKNYINVFNPFNNNMSKNLISEENIIPIKKMENIGNIEIISEEKLGIYNNYIAPYLTVENLIYLGTFVIISGITYYCFNYYFNVIDEIKKNEELELLKKINDNAFNNPKNLFNTNLDDNLVFLPNVKLTSIKGENIELLNLDPNVGEKFSEIGDFYGINSININTYNDINLTGIVVNDLSFYKKLINISNSVVFGELGSEIISKDLINFNDDGLPKVHKDLEWLEFEYINELNLNELLNFKEITLEEYNKLTLIEKVNLQEEYQSFLLKEIIENGKEEIGKEEIIENGKEEIIEDYEIISDIENKNHK